MRRPAWLKKIENAPPGAGLKWWECERKKVYPTRSGARENPMIGTGLNKSHYSYQPYKCRFCEKWHIGQEAKKFAKRTRKGYKE